MKIDLCTLSRIFPLCLWLGTGSVRAAPPGTVVAWGYNSEGQATVPVAAQSGVIAVAAGGAHTMALKADGSVIVWGSDRSELTTVPVRAQGGVVAIAAGDRHNVVLTTSGGVMAWGHNAFQQIHAPPWPPT